MEENTESPELMLPQEPKFEIFTYKKRWHAAVFIAVLAFCLYIPSLDNEYALDDGIIIHQNSYVLKGVMGISKIMSSDIYESFYKRMNATDQLMGGRYRPLAAVSYALEQELIGVYRTGYYQWTVDANANGVLDEEKVLSYGYGSVGDNYEYNDYIDLNGDGQAQANECYSCWDTNMNFSYDNDEDLNADGVFNEVDCQVRGAGLRHFNNMLLYALCCFVMYLLFSTHWFRDKQDLAFLAAFIFTIHPVHSEVVANVRGRDDIFSLIFICLTFFFTSSFFKEKNPGHLIAASLMFLMALLSKEYAALMIVLLPIAIYVFDGPAIKLWQVLLAILSVIVFACGMIGIELVRPENVTLHVLMFVIAVFYPGLVFLLFHRSVTNKSNIVVLLVLQSVFILYLAARINSVKIAPGIPDTELLNNPFLYADQGQAVATKMLSLLHYLRLFFLPHPLVSDYSYASVPFIELSDWRFMLSLIIHLCLLAAGIYYSIQRKAIGFAILCYVIFIVPVSNLFFPTSLMMNESFLFHASMGGAIAIACLMINAFDTLPQLSLPLKRSLVYGLLFIITILSFIKCWERSLDWKNDVTLFLKDVNNAPNSVLVLGNAGARWVDLADTREITGESLPGDTRPLNDYNGTLHISDEELAESGLSSKKEVAVHKAIKYLDRAVELHPKYVNGYLNLGLAYYKLENDFECIRNWKIAEFLYPSNPYLRNYYQVYGNQLKHKADTAFRSSNFDDAQKYYALKTILTPLSAEAWYDLGGAQYHRDRTKAYFSFKKAESLDPNDQNIKEALSWYKSAPIVIEE